MKTVEIRIPEAPVSVRNRVEALRKRLSVQRMHHVPFYGAALEALVAGLDALDAREEKR